MLLSFTAMLGLRKLQRGVIGAPDAARGAVYPPPPPECHHHTLGLQEDTEGASRVREGLVVNNHNFLDEIESTFSDRESTLGLASGGRLPCGPTNRRPLLYLERKGEAK